MVFPITLDVLSVFLDTTLKGIILGNPSLKEPDIIKKYIDVIKHGYDNNRPLTIHIPYSGKYELKIKSEFVHQKPYALFNSSNKPCSRSRVELGDILFVVKYYNEDRLLEQMRASFLQAKLSKNNRNWKISTHQQEFLLTPSEYPFHFGKKWDLKRRTRRITPVSEWLFTYLLMSTNENVMNIAATPEIVELERKQDRCKDYDFTFPPRGFSEYYPYYYFYSYHHSHKENVLMTENGVIEKIIEKATENPFVTIKEIINELIIPPFYSFSSLKIPPYAVWLHEFLEKNGIGEYIIKNRWDVNSELGDLIDAIYRFTGLQPDPPGEFDEYSEEGAFGIVEFTFAPPEGEVEHRRFE